MRKRPNDNAVKRGFENKGKGTDLSQAVAQIRESPFIAESYTIAKDLVQKAKLALSLLPDNDAKRSLLALADYVLERDK